MTRFLLPSLLVAGLLSGCSEKEAPVDTTAEESELGSARIVIQQGYETPEAAFAALQKAASEQNYPQMVSTLTRESQQAMAGQMIFALQMVAAFDSEQEPEIRKLMEKHGLTEESRNQPPPDADVGTGPAAMVRAIGSMVRSPGDFVADALKWMESSSDDSEMDEWGSGTLSEVSIDADRASATITDNDEVSPIEFRKISTGWLVHIPDEEFDMSMAAGEGSDQTDFDEFRYHFDEEDELPPPAPITAEAFTEAWQTSASFSEVVAADALANVAAEAGLKLFEQPELAETLQQKVSVDLQNVSRLQVIEAICEQVGLYPRYKLKTVAFAEGPRPYPVTFAGPFAVYVEEVELHVPYPTGRLTLTMFAAGLPTPMVSQMANLNTVTNEESADSITLSLNGVSHDGNPLTRKNVMYGAMRQASESTIMFSRSYELINLLQDVENIDPIKGSVTWPFPTKIDVLKFAELKPDTEAKAGDAMLKLIRAGTGDNPQLRVQVEGVDCRSVNLVARNEQGEALSNNFHSASDFGSQAFVEVMVEGSPATLEAQIVAASDRATFDYEMPAIPLPDHEQMPAELTELSIEGPSPLTFDQVKVKQDGQFRKILANATNQTNKPIHQILVKMDYIDDDGTVLKDFQHSQQGNRILLEAGASDEVEITAFFMPEEATNAKLRPAEIGFADGTRWQAEE
ncbi:MAG: hypothetical protein Fues2KO_43710 [Fuerstiella sp.]